MNTANTTDNRELAAGRIDKISQVLRERRIVKVNDLCALLNASPASIRRDLADMEQHGQLRRVHGGAVFTENRLDEPLFDDKTSIAASEKQKIAEAAFRYVKPTDIVYLDGGSTVLALAPLLASMPKLTVVTNSLRVAGTLAGEGPRLILVGGELRRRSQTFVGTLTRPMLDQIHLDTAFMGTLGLSDEGMTTTDAGEAYTKELVMSRARHVILLADSSKIGKISFVKAGSLDSVNTLITDSGVDRKTVEQMKKKGIKVHLV